MVSDNSNNKNSQNKAPSENDKRSLAITDIDIDEKRLNYLDIIRENTNHNRVSNKQKLKKKKKKKINHIYIIM